MRAYLSIEYFVDLLFVFLDKLLLGPSVSELLADLMALEGLKLSLVRLRHQVLLNHLAAHVVVVLAAADALLRQLDHLVVKRPLDVIVGLLGLRPLL